MIDHEEKIKDALAGIPSLKALCSSWPDDKTKYPAIVVDLAADQSSDFRDDRPYLVELEYYIRIFDTDPTKKRMRAVLAEVDTRMEALGYTRTFRFEQNENNVKQWVTRYKTMVSAG